MTKEEQAALDDVKPICIDCKHYDDSDEWSAPKCARSISHACNVTGRISHRECHDERNRGLQGSCGKQGVFFESTPESPSLYIKVLDFLGVQHG